MIVLVRTANVELAHGYSLMTLTRDKTVSREGEGANAELNATVWGTVLGANTELDCHLV